MKALILMRHGAFTHDDPSEGDLDHPLSRAGKRQVAGAAKHFKTMGISPDVILSSPARRAVETAKIFAQKVGLSEDLIEISDGLYEAELPEMMRVVRAISSNHKLVMLVGHNPGITQLLHNLIETNLEPARLASVWIVKQHVTRWSSVSFRTGALLYQDNCEKNGQIRSLWEKIIFWRNGRAQKFEVFFMCFFAVIIILFLTIFIAKMTVDSSAAPPETQMPTYISTE